MGGREETWSARERERGWQKIANCARRAFFCNFHGGLIGAEVVRPAGGNGSPGEISIVAAGWALSYCAGKG